MSLRIFNSLKPVIGAINGAAVGVGITMTLPMDIRLASESAKLVLFLRSEELFPRLARRISCLVWSVFNKQLNGSIPGVYLAQTRHWRVAWCVAFMLRRICCQRHKHLHVKLQTTPLRSLLLCRAK